MGCFQSQPAAAAETGSLHKTPEQWTRQDVQKWLLSIGMQKYKQEFGAVDGQMLLSLNREQLKLRLKDDWDLMCIEGALAKIRKTSPSRPELLQQPAVAADGKVLVGSCNSRDSWKTGAFAASASEHGDPLSALSSVTTDVPSLESISTTHPNQWNRSHVQLWLQHVRLPHLQGKFQAVSGRALLRLNRESASRRISNEFDLVCFEEALADLTQAWDTQIRESGSSSSLPRGSGKEPSGNPENWNRHQVEAWLKAEGLAAYVDQFKAVTGPVLLRLEEYMVKSKISDTVDTICFMDALDKLKVHSSFSKDGHVSNWMKSLQGVKPSSMVSEPGNRASERLSHDVDQATLEIYNSLDALNGSECSFVQTASAAAAAAVRRSQGSATAAAAARPRPVSLMDQQLQRPLAPGKAAPSVRSCAVSTQSLAVCPPGVLAAVESYNSGAVMDGKPTLAQRNAQATAGRIQPGLFGANDPLTVPPQTSEDFAERPDHQAALAAVQNLVTAKSADLDDRPPGLVGLQLRACRSVPAAVAASGSSPAMPSEQNRTNAVRPSDHQAALAAVKSLVASRPADSAKKASTSQEASSSRQPAAQFAASPNHQAALAAVQAASPATRLGPCPPAHRQGPGGQQQHHHRGPQQQIPPTAAAAPINSAAQMMNHSAALAALKGGVKPVMANQTHDRGSSWKPPAPSTAPVHQAPASSQVAAPLGSGPSAPPAAPGAAPGGPTPPIQSSRHLAALAALQGITKPTPSPAHTPASTTTDAPRRQQHHQPITISTGAAQAGKAANQTAALAALQGATKAASTDGGKAKQLLSPVTTAAAAPNQPLSQSTNHLAALSALQGVGKASPAHPKASLLPAPKAPHPAAQISSPRRGQWSHGGGGNAMAGSQTVNYAAIQQAMKLAEAQKSAQSSTATATAAETAAAAAAAASMQRQASIGALQKATIRELPGAWVMGSPGDPNVGSSSSPFENHAPEPFFGCGERPLTDELALLSETKPLRSLSFDNWKQEQDSGVATDWRRTCIAEEEEEEEEEGEEEEEEAESDYEYEYDSPEDEDSRFCSFCGELSEDDFEATDPNQATEDAVMERLRNSGSSSYFPLGLNSALREWWEAEFGAADAEAAAFTESLEREMEVAKGRMPSVAKAREKEARNVLARAFGHFGLPQPPPSTSSRSLYSLQLYCGSWATSRRQPAPASLADHLVVVLQASGANPVGDGAALRGLRSKLAPVPVPERLRVLASCTPDFARWALKAYDEWLPTTKRFLVIRGSPDQGTSAIACMIGACRSTTVAGVHLGRRGDARRNNLENVIASLAYQLCVHLPKLRPVLSKVLDQQTDITSLTARHKFEGLLQFPLSQLDARATSAVIVLDNVGCEETDAPNQLSKALPQWVSALPSWVRLVVTTQEPDDKLEVMLNNHSSEVIAAEDPRWTQALARHLDHSLRSHLGMDKDASAEAAKVMVGKSRGSLTHASSKLLDLINLSRAHPEADLMEEATHFPWGLTGMWDEAVGCLSRNGVLDREGPLQASLLLPVIAAARQPLSFSQLEEVTGAEGAEGLLGPLAQVLSVDDGAVMATHRGFWDALQDKGLLEAAEGHRLLAEWQELFFKGLHSKSATGRVLAGPSQLSAYPLLHIFAHRAADPQWLSSILGNLAILQAQFELGRGYDFCREVARVLRSLEGGGSAGTPGDRRLLEEGQEVLRFLQMHCSTLQRAPTGILQEALSCPTGSFPRRRAEALAREEGFDPRGVSHWLNAPARAPPQRMSLQGHSACVTCMTVMEDGTCISGSDDKTIRLWDLDTGETLRALRGHRGAIRALAGDASRMKLASGGEDGAVRVWCLLSGASFVVDAEAGSWILSVAWLEGGLLASGSSKRETTIWRLGYGATDTAKCLRVLKGHSGPVNCLLALPGGRLATGSWDNSVLVWDVGTGRLEATLSGHTQPVRSLAAALDSSKLISCSADGTVRTWDPQSGSCQVLEAHQSWVNGVKQLRDGRLVTCADDDEIRVWSPEGRLQHTLKGHMNCIRGIATIPGTNWLVSCSDDLSLRVWELPDCTPAAPDVDEAGPPATDGHTGPINAVAVLPGGLVASGGSDCRVILWDLQGKQKAILEGQGMKCWVTSLAPLGKDNLAVGSYLNIHIWNLPEQKLLRTLSGHQGMVTSLAVLPSGSLVSGSEDENLMVWNWRTGERLNLLKGQTRKPGVRQYWCSHLIHALVVLPGEGPGGSAAVASAASDLTVRLWDPEGGSGLLRSFNSHGGGVLSLAALPGRRLASGSEDKTITLWDLATGQSLGRLEGHTGWVCSLAVDLEGRLVSAAYDRSIRVWDTESLRETRVLRRHFVKVQALAVVPDGRILSGASDPPCLCLWSAMDPVPNTVQYGITIASFIAMGPAAWLQQQPCKDEGEG